MGNNAPNEKLGSENEVTSIKINKKECKIIKKLGEGTFGKVFQVLSKSNNKYYAIKIIPIQDKSDDVIKSFEKEAEILSKLNSNNIIKYYDSSKDNNNSFYILMEYCD